MVKARGDAAGWRIYWRFAALIAATALVRHHDPAEAVALGGVLALRALLGLHFAPALKPG